MMYEGFNLGAFLLGLPLGLLVTSIIGFFVLKKGKKERKYDERYTMIHRHARSIAWFAMYFAILLAWAVVLMVEPPGLAFWILTILWIVHTGAYGIGTGVANRSN